VNGRVTPCGLATCIGPESCGAAREGGVEALTGERAVLVFSRVRDLLRDAEAVGKNVRTHLVHRYREECQSPARSETPCTYADTTHGNGEIPSSARAAVALGRIRTLLSGAFCRSNRIRSRICLMITFDSFA